MFSVPFCEILLVWIRVRYVFRHGLIKDFTGSRYLHVEKILITCIFGRENFHFLDKRCVQREREQLSNKCIIDCEKPLCRLSSRNHLSTLEPRAIASGIGLSMLD